MNEIQPHVDRGALPVRNWDKFRDQMPITENWTYFDHAAVSPLTQPALEALQTWSVEAAKQGDVQWLKWERRVEEVRRIAARMVNAEVSEIGLIPNTTTGIGYVAEGLDWNPGDNIVTPGGEFPSNVYPWENLESRGVELRVVDTVDGQVDLNQLANACDERTRLLTLSWVGFSCGYRIDPAAAASVAHDHGALLFLDAIQGLGVFPLDVRKSKVDFFAADGHKWMLGPEGAGLFYVKREHLSKLRPLCVGWNSVAQRHSFSRQALEIRNEVSRYEGGSQNMAGFHALAASLELLTAFGLGPESSPIADRVLELTGILAEKLKRLNATIYSHLEDEHRSGIVSFGFAGKSPDEIRNFLMKHGVVLSVRNGRLRVAIHCYNNEDDLQQLVELLEEFLKNQDLAADG